MFIALATLDCAPGRRSACCAWLCTLPLVLQRFLTVLSRVMGRQFCSAYYTAASHWVRLCSCANFEILHEYFIKYGSTLFRTYFIKFFYERFIMLSVHISVELSKLFLNHFLKQLWKFLFIFHGMFHRIFSEFFYWYV